MRSATRKKTGKDPEYLVWLHDLPCLVCRPDGVGMQLSRTEAAHVGDRGLSQKCPDREAIPLCRIHHRISPDSVHALQKKFWAKWSIDRDEIIRKLNARYEEEHNGQTIKVS